MLSLIIDRVGNVNIFNVLEGNIPGEESHIQSTIDDDLILEYIEEVERLVRVSHAVLNHSNKMVNADILQDLRTLGETFFHQFFPESIIEKLKTTHKRSIHFNIDPALAMIPWELLHDGNAFLSDKFRIGKTIRGGVHSSPHRFNQKIKMLIIADPTEDLLGAQKEGEALFSILSQKVPSDLLELEFIGGKQVTKLKLLSLIKDKHIIHYSGHLHFSEDSLENGWLLSDGKILKAREIKSSGIDTDLVFSNSCMSAKSAGKKINNNFLNQYAGAFLTAGIKTFIGTNWEILDNERTIDFTIRFYTAIFAQKSVGESLFYAKEYARRNYHSNDLTWANYSLFGNPDFKIVTNEKSQNPTQKIINPSAVTDFYPSPIASSYSKFLITQKSNASEVEILKATIHVFESFSQVIGMIIFSDHKSHSMDKAIPNNLDDAINLRKWWELVYSCLWDFQKLKISTFLDSISLKMNAQKETIFKIISWLETWEDKSMQKEEYESYLIILQFFIENLLLEMNELEFVSILLVSENQNPHYYFKGKKPSFGIPSTSLRDKDLFLSHKGNLVMYHEKKKMILPYVTYFKEKRESGDLELVFSGLIPTILEKSKI
ncbi:CHAT domain-containing protein [Leptospira ognonensis]|uniref:CHAT domain-containing protein n=1 Tax=Leptospira ognonensis TaxID=2484945 RepID=A0A4V6QM60_9LEPT|nr:CHAT domain-containing protein [Leptospira ognonensis]TGL60085.1 CHAT domain-containing protein [Leptospira ognonensis]